MKKIFFNDFPDFEPNLTPRDIFKLGSFGGTYWRPIHSTIVNKNYKNQHIKFPKEWWDGINDEYMTHEKYNKSINKYGVKVGQGLKEWEESGWITSHDPYGWVQWYCNFYNGRRTNDDERQIKRWKNIASKKSGRFRTRLINDINKVNGKYNDKSISPVMRQILQHWAYKLTKKDFDDHKNR
jgi:hypothetical protein